VAQRRVLLIGGGHSHIEVLRRFALRPDSAIELTLVSPNARTPYTGMLPGLIAGHYTAADVHIDLPPLASWARARFVCDRVVALDLYTRTVRLGEGGLEPFDLVSIDVGSVPDASVAGARERALGVKPIDRFLAAWPLLQDDAAAGKVRTIVVVGGGAGGVEALLAMQYRLAQTLGAEAPRFALVTDAPHVLPEQARSVRKRLGTLLVARDVVLHTGSAVVAVDSGGVVTADGRRIAADRVVWATGAAAAPWLAASSLECDARGFVRVNRHLQSISDPLVFAAGDCAALEGQPRPKAGVFAVREGPPLAANLRHAVRQEALEDYAAQRRALALITTGERRAVAAWGPFAAEGRWAWRWKDRIDRAFCARYRMPPPAGAA
jgi:selenide,water dikinase